MFHVNLYPLPRIKHFFVWFRDIFGVRRFNGYESKTAENTPKRRNRARIATLSELYPEYNQSCMRITSTHIRDEFNFIFGVLVVVTLLYHKRFVSATFFTLFVSHLL